MTGTADLDTTRAWMADGTTFLHAQLDGLGDADLTTPSRLPDWSRVHVLAHVARNADALVNLLTWARTGIDTPMYASLEQRGHDIESGARQSPAALRADVRDSSDRLKRAVAELPHSAWPARVRSARGREIPASEVPWMRVREVWLHAVDLDTEASCTDLPAPVVDALLSDVTGSFTTRTESPSLRISPTDRQERWHVGDQSAPDEISGPASELLGWLTGRDTGASLRTAGGGALPRLPAWL